MKKVCFIVGLPGSGKTYLAEEMLEKYPNTFLLDDPSENFSVLDFVKNFTDEREVIVCDPLLCSENIRDRAMVFFKNWETQWIFFENNEEKCKKNLAYRNDNRIINSFKAFNYTIPEGVIPREIWQPTD